jgi:hypothetical protein
VYISLLSFPRDSPFLSHDGAVSCREGWAPICAFLGLEEGEGCPTTPYPRVNDAAEFARVLEGVEFVTEWWAWIAVGSTLNPQLLTLNPKP